MTTETSTMEIRILNLSESNCILRAKGKFQLMSIKHHSAYFQFHPGNLTK